MVQISMNSYSDLITLSTAVANKATGEMIPVSAGVGDLIYFPGDSPERIQFEVMRGFYPEIPIDLGLNLEF